MNTETQNYEQERKILDSGERKQFESGAVRDIQEGKGRLDLLPLGEVSDFFMLLKDTHEETLESCKWANYSAVTFFINLFMQTQDRSWILKAIKQFAQSIWDEPFTPILELAKHYEEGAKKYSDRNWEKGIPCHCYIDSGLRHLTEFYRGDADEPHERAFLWNMFGLLWTLRNRPECNDLPYAEKLVSDEKEDDKGFIVEFDPGMCLACKYFAGTNKKCDHGRLVNSKIVACNIYEMKREVAENG